MDWIVGEESVLIKETATIVADNLAFENGVHREQNRTTHYAIVEYLMLYITNEAVYLKGVNWNTELVYGSIPTTESFLLVGTLGSHSSRIHRSSASSRK